MTDPLPDRVRLIISRIFSVPLADIRPDSGYASLPGWDSLGQLNVILSLEEQFGISIPPEDGESMLTVEAIVRALPSLIESRGEQYPT